MKKRAMLIAEKSSFMKDARTAYNKIKNTLDFEVDFYAFRGHFLELVEPNEYKDKWSNWDINELPMIPDKFKTKPKKDILSQYKNLKEAIFSGYDFVINACDAGREGQAIFWFFYENVGATLPVKRLWVNDNVIENIGKAYHKLIDSEEDIMKNLKKASFNRAYFDWLIGMNFTRAVSLKANKTISVGRVKTPILKIIVDRELERRNFKSEKYFKLEAEFKEGFSGTWYSENKDSFPKREEVEELQKKLGKEGFVKSYETNRKVKNPPPLYNLSELQSDGYKAFGFTAKETLNIAQKLYDERKLITYPRTDSRALSTSLSEEIKDHLNAIKDIKEISSFYAQITDKDIKNTMNSKKYVDNKKITDHHAIIPTINKPNLNDLSKKEKDIYLMIVRKFISIFLKPYLTDKTIIISEIDGETFKTNGNTVVDLGYREIFDYSPNENSLPNLNEKDKLILKDSNVLEYDTRPPLQYDTSSLFKILENPTKLVEDDYKDILKEVSGIGTVATRANIVESLIYSKMITRTKGKFSSTDFGEKIIQILGDRNFVSPELTAKWEEKLKEVEDGEKTSDDFQKEMIRYIKTETKDLIDNIEKTFESDNDFKEIGVCPKCENKVIKTNKYYLCSEYKKTCDFIVGLKQNGANINEKDMNKILSGEKTEFKTFTSKKKKKFQAKLYYDKDKGKIQFSFGEETDLKCPKCQSNIIDNGTYFSCDDKNCKFSISEEILGTKLAKEDIKKIINGQETKEYTFKFSKGKGQAKLKYNKDKDKLSFIFKNTNEKIGQCPDCGSDFFFKGNYAKCSNCDTSFSTKIKGAKLTKKDITDLINGKETSKKTFQWNANSSSSAKMKYNKNKKKLEFIFENKK